MTPRTVRTAPAAGRYPLPPGAKVIVVPARNSPDFQHTAEHLTKKALRAHRVNLGKIHVQLAPDPQASQLLRAQAVRQQARRHLAAEQALRMGAEHQHGRLRFARVHDCTAQNGGVSDMESVKIPEGNAHPTAA